MKGFRFYLEFPDAKTKKKSGKENKGHSGNVFAVMDFYGDGFRPLHYGVNDWRYEGIGAIYFHPNSACTNTAASWDYLRVYCKRIPEAKAREIHPALFEYLERPEPLRSLREAGAAFGMRVEML